MSEREPILGNTTKFSSHEEKREGRDSFVHRYGNTALRFYMLEIARNLLPNERIQVCWRYPLPERKTVEIIYSPERQCARSKGTMKCGSGWVCPACMRYIAERRRDELETALHNSQDEYFSIMATFTASHGPQDSLEGLLKRMVKAYGNVFSGRWWADMRPDLMIQGAIRATEITYGANGWHPHFHVIYLVKREMLTDGYAGSPDEYAQGVRNHLGARWLEMLTKQGLSGSAERAIDVRVADKDIADYVAKYGRMPQDWTANVSAYEVSHAVTKTPKGGNLGVLDILYNAADDKRMAQLFLEYHAATKGRSQLQWSKGLKKLLDIEVIRDEIAAQGVETETDRLLAEIHIDLWRFLTKRGYLGQLMTYANAGDDGKVSWLLDGLREQMSEQVIDLPQIDIGL